MIGVVCASPDRRLALLGAAHLLHHGADVTRIGDGPPPLWEAARRGEVALLGLLLRFGAPRDTCHDGSTALGEAVRRDDFECAAVLLAWGADPDDGGHPDLRPLAHATRNANAVLAQLLIAHGADTEDVGGGRSLAAATDEAEAADPSQDWEVFRAALTGSIQ